MYSLPPYILISASLTAAAIIWAFFIGLFTRNYSTVDRLWSILPGIYVLIGLPWLFSSPRYLIAGLIILAWSVRLTRNFAVKGGYKRKNGRFTEEDYRWPVLKKRIPNRIAFEIFNFFFISTFQLCLIYFFTLPLFIAGASNTGLGPWDILLFTAHAFFLVMETIADEQQLRYYARRGNSSAPRIGLGFNTFGLWRFSRHPNYICEMSQWVVVSLYPLAAGLSWFPWGIAALVLILLFIGSTNMAEGITAGKYSRYAEWRKATPPWFPFGVLLRLKARKRFWESLEVSEES